MKKLLSLIGSPRLPLFIILVVSQLLFLTDLTRNPYQIQISILNIALVWIAALHWIRQIKEPRDLPEWTLTEIIFLALILWAGVTVIVSWARHPLLRPSVFYEGLKGWLFITVNGFLAFQLGRRTGKESASGWGDVPVARMLWLAALWGALWLPFHGFKNGDSAIWDPYGALVWTLLFLGLILWFKMDSTTGGLSMILFVSVTAGGYSILQHFGRDLIWGSVLDPYNGRPISTFGNPNFLSSWLVMTLPVAAALVITSRNRARLASSGLLGLVIGLALLYTSTRSSWAGGLAALAMLAALCWKDLEPQQSRTLRALALSALGVLVLCLASPWRGVLLEPLARGRELFNALRTGQSLPAINQRLLIWHCAWDMVRKSPWLGTGWGCFEMFFPFYQGPLLFNPTLNYRTHANNAHQLLLELASQMGLIGLGLFCGLLILTFRSLWEARKVQKGPDRVILSGILAGCVGMIIDNLLGNVSLFFAAPALLFWWLLGLGNGIAKEPVAVRVGRPALARCAAVLLVAGALAAGVWTGQRLEADESFYLGFKLSRAGRASEAIPFLERSLHLDGSDVDNDYELGNSDAQEARVLQASKQPDLAREKHEQAVGAYGAAIAANPGYDEIYFNRATELAALGKPEQAYDDLAMTLWINPLYRNAYTMLASLTMTLPARNDQTLSLLLNGLRLFPTDVDLMNDTGYFLVATRRLKEAKEMFQRALAVNPQSAIARNNLNNVLRQMGGR